MGIRGTTNVIEVLNDRIADHKQPNGLCVLGFSLREKKLVPIQDVAINGAYNLWTCQVAWGEDFWWGSCEASLQFGESVPGRPVELRGSFCAIFDDPSLSQEVQNEASCDTTAQATGACGDLVLVSEAPYPAVSMSI